MTATWEAAYGPDGNPAVPSHCASAKWSAQAGLASPVSWEKAPNCPSCTRALSSEPHTGSANRHQVWMFHPAGQCGKSVGAPILQKNQPLAGLPACWAAAGRLPSLWSNCNRENLTFFAAKARYIPVNPVFVHFPASFVWCRGQSSRSSPSNDLREVGAGTKNSLGWKRIKRSMLSLAMGTCIAGDVPPSLSSRSIWSPIPNETEIGREEALFRRADHRLPA